MRPAGHAFGFPLAVNGDYGRQRGRPDQLTRVRGEAGDRRWRRSNRRRGPRPIRRVIFVVIIVVEDVGISTSG